MCLNCGKESEDKYCSTECYMAKAGFTYHPPIQPRYEIKQRYPCALNDCGQGPTPWLYDNKNQEFVRKAILS